MVTESYADPQAEEDSATYQSGYDTGYSEGYARAQQELSDAASSLSLPKRPKDFAASFGSESVILNFCSKPFFGKAPNVFCFLPYISSGPRNNKIPF